MQLHVRDLIVLQTSDCLTGFLSAYITQKGAHHQDLDGCLSCTRIHDVADERAKT